MNETPRNTSGEFGLADSPDFTKENPAIQERGLVDKVAAKAKEYMPEEIGHDVADAVKDAGRNISNATSYVRQKADDMATAVGGAMEQTGHYLRDDGINKITSELTSLVRRNPLPALLAGVAVGFLIAQTMQRRSEYPRNGEIHA